MKCSIVIATYNKAKELALSLRSIRQQDVPFKYEIIVVDDGSSDGTRNVAMNYGARYAYLARPYYSNPSKARNVGFCMAKGEIVVQQCEVIHHSPNVVNALVESLTPGTFAIASTWDATLGTGEPSPMTQPYVAVSRGLAYSGPLNPRPFFFLGAVYRDDLEACGGYDEDFTLPGYDDNWHADCLIYGLGLRPIQLAQVQGIHISHSRPEWIPAAQEEMRRLYECKRQLGIFRAATTCLRRPPRPWISIACLIYKSTKMADWVAESIEKFTPLIATGEAEFYFVANDASETIKAHLLEKRYQHYVQTNVRLTEQFLSTHGYAGPEYINRVYRGWNEAIRHARGELVVLVNSDHFFSPCWLENLVKHFHPQRIVTSQLVERNHPKYGTFPGAYQQDFGSSVDSFRQNEWLAYCGKQSQQVLRSGGAYMPCLFSKEMAERVGLYPEGNVRSPSSRNVHLYGDQAFFAKLGAHGVDHVTAMDSLVYHLKEGEIES